VRGARQEQHRQGYAHLATLALISGCIGDAASVDGAFYDGDRRKVHCAINLDASAGNMPTIDGALDRARDRGEIVELYAHKPGVTVDVEDIEHVLAGAVDRGLAFVTYRDFALHTETLPGIALSFDDSSVALWFALRPLFTTYNARVTFFISRYARLGAELEDMVSMLAADGHDIAAHSVEHLRAPTYVEERGLGPYLRDEALPSIDVLREVGFDVTSFAYPFGARTSELDDALLEHVSVLRSVSFSIEGVPDPCPH
jgi:peptidoglycan/xylan/chitin deacetylase (PgdA/CDA1 family)